MFCIFFCRFPVRYRTGSAVRSIMNDLWIVSVSVFFFFGGCCRCCCCRCCFVSIRTIIRSNPISPSALFGQSFHPLIDAAAAAAAAGNRVGAPLTRPHLHTGDDQGGPLCMPFAYVDSVDAICMRLALFFFFFCSLSLSLSLSLHLFAD